jgi:hypothetical protein
VPVILQAAARGYWTRYLYNPLGRLTTVTQNAQGTGTKRVWKYDTTVATNETVVTDPSGNDTVYPFYTGSSSQSVNKTLYETQRQIYQGSWKTVALLETVVTCYNGNTTNCANPSTAVGVDEYPGQHRHHNVVVHAGWSLCFASEAIISAGIAVLH